MRQIKSSNVINTTKDPSLLLEQAPVDSIESTSIEIDDSVSDFQILDTADSVITIKDPTSTVVITPVLDAPNSLYIVEQMTSLGEDGVTYVDIEFEIGDVPGATDYEFRLVKI